MNIIPITTVRYPNEYKKIEQVNPTHHAGNEQQELDPYRKQIFAEVKYEATQENNSRPLSKEGLGQIIDIMA